MAGFAGIAALLIGSFLLINGITPLYNYYQASQLILSLPYNDGFPGYIIITLNGFLSSILPPGSALVIQMVSLLFLVIAAGVVALIAYQHRFSSQDQQIPTLALAIVFPLAFSPYVQLHDLLLIAPIFIFWARYDTSSRGFITAVITYVGTFFLTLLAAITGVAWIAIITLGLFVQILIWNHYQLKNGN